MSAPTNRSAKVYQKYFLLRPKRKRRNPTARPQPDTHGSSTVLKGAGRSFWLIVVDLLSDVVKCIKKIQLSSTDFFWLFCEFGHKYKFSSLFFFFFPFSFFLSFFLSPLAVAYQSTTSFMIIMAAQAKKDRKEKRKEMLGDFLFQKRIKERRSWREWESWLFIPSTLFSSEQFRKEDKRKVGAWSVGGRPPKRSETFQCWKMRNNGENVILTMLIPLSS